MVKNVMVHISGFKFHMKIDRIYLKHTHQLGSELLDAVSVGVAIYEHVPDWLVVLKFRAVLVEWCRVDYGCLGGVLYRQCEK